jgi:hypothetical protein
MRAGEESHDQMISDGVFRIVRSDRQNASGDRFQESANMLEYI